MEYLSVNKVFLTVIGYPMSYIEFVGTVLYLLSVILIARRNMLTWPIGIISVLLYMKLFHEIRLYSDAMEQVYYLGASCYGWWYWKSSQSDVQELVNVERLSLKARAVWGVVIMMLSLLLGILMQDIHTIFPSIFPEPASYPFLDAFTTVASFVAMWLLARKYYESWMIWIVVDVIGIWLYYVKSIKFISLLYVVLLVIAVNGLIGWAKGVRSGEVESGE